MNRSERGALIAWAVLLGVVLAIVVDGWFMRADAFRPVPGYDYPDLCRNRGAYAMPGVQTVALFSVNRVRFVAGSEPNRLGRRDCVRLGRGR